MTLDSIKDFPGIEGQGYILTRKGMVQLYGQNGRLGVIVAMTHAAAKKLKKRWKCSASIAKVGTIPGETLEHHFVANRSLGGTGLWITDGNVLHWLTPA
jgi:hypothetical protein